MQSTIQLPLTPQEAEVLLSLLDLGVKNPNGGGLNVAINAGFFLQKIRALQQSAEGLDKIAPEDRCPTRGS